MNFAQMALLTIDGYDFSLKIHGPELARNLDLCNGRIATLIRNGNHIYPRWNLLQPFSRRSGTPNEVKWPEHALCLCIGITVAVAISGGFLQMC